LTWGYKAEVKIGHQRRFALDKTEQADKEKTKGKIGKLLGMMKEHLKMT